MMFGTIAMVLLGTLILAQAISILGLPKEMVTWVSEMGLSRYEVLFAIVLVYLVLGCFFDGISLLLMTLPMAFPLMMSMQFDPVWFGIIVTILMEVGMITPPVGLNLFVLVTVAKRQVPLGTAAWATVPYWLIMLGTVALFTVFPDIVLFVPNLLFP